MKSIFLCIEKKRRVGGLCANTQIDKSGKLDKTPRIVRVEDKELSDYII